MSKFINKTNTIVLLYDGERMHGQINPGCVSIEISDDVAKNSPTIQQFLNKKVIAVFDEKKDKMPTPFTKQASASFVAHTPPTSLDTNVEKNAVPSQQAVPVQKEVGIVVHDIDSIDRVDDLGDGEIVIKDKKDPIGGKSVSIPGYIDKTVKATVKKTKEELDALEAKRAAARAAKVKLEKAPTEIKQFIAKKFMEKKWAILKSNDAEWLKQIAEYDASVEKLVAQRLSELSN